ncbi:MAG: methyl-accepting chemotaxis protein, partial [bacterium]|nr:methyl-accepting chemotaxis protein [bacterium]
MFKSIQFKMMLLGGLPLLVALVFMLNSIRGNSRMAGEMNDLLTLSQFAVKISALVHEIQSERGITAGFMGSDGVTFVDELTEQRQQTDAGRTKFEQALDTLEPDAYGEEFNDRVNLAVNAIAGLDDHRTAVSKQAIPDAQGMAFYTHLNGLMLDMIQVISTAGPQADMARFGTAYVNFLQGKERAGQERAVMSKVFAADRFAADELRRFSLLVNDQYTYFGVFLSLALPEHVSMYEQKMADPVINEVQHMREIAFARDMATAKGTLLIDLVRHFGYGGVIHHFKNFVLRKTPNDAEQFGKNSADIAHILDQLQALPETRDRDMGQIAIIRDTISMYQTAITRAAEMFQSGKTIVEVDRAIKVDDAPALRAIKELAATLDARNFGVDVDHWFASITKKIDLMKEVENRLSADLHQQAAALKTDARNTLVFLSLIVGVVVIGILTAMSLIARGIIRPVDQIVRIAEGIAEGDLSQDIDIRRYDEIGKLADAFRHMQKDLSLIVADVQSISANVAAGSQTMSFRSGQMSQGATEQAATAEEVSSSMEQMAANIRQTADNALQTEKIALKAAT